MSLQGLVKKKFVLYYKPEFIGGEKIQLIEGMDFFTEENGFSFYDIDEIGNMEHDDTLEISLPLRIWRVM